MVIRDITLVGNSPGVIARRELLDAIPITQSLPENWNIGDFTKSATIPLDNLRRQLNRQGVPASEYLGEGFERQVYGQLYEYFSVRNRGDALDGLARDALFQYEMLSWITNAAGRRTGVRICVTPSPLVVSDQEWTDFVKQWAVWLLPYFDGDVAVIVCQSASTTLTLQAAQVAVVYQAIEVS